MVRRIRLSNIMAIQKDENPGLDFDRSDVLAADLEHILDAAMEHDLAFLVDRAQVARMEPAILDRGRRRLGKRGFRHQLRKVKKEPEA